MVDFLTNWFLVCSYHIIAERIKQIPFCVFISFSTVLLRRYLGWTAGEKPLLVSLWTVEAILMTSWSLWTVLLSTYTPSLVSFQFCYCLILFVCEDRCESMCMLLHWCSSVQTLYSGKGCLGPDIQCPLWRGHCVYKGHQESACWVDQAVQELIIVEAVSKGFVTQGFILLFALYIFIFFL